VAEFAEVYDEQLPRVYGYIAYQVLDVADAEDLTQQTFERALTHWSEFDSRRASVGTWLLSIARNLVIDAHRARGRRPASVPLESASSGDAEQTSPAPSDPGVSPELERALTALDDRERDLIALRYGAELSGPGIAEITGITVTNVQQILSRARKTLRRELEL
jgi:RNA polymerase sigma-70 factor (ECF subfamily)